MIAMKKEQEKEQLIQEMAKLILEQNEEYIGVDVAKEAEKELEKLIENTSENKEKKKTVRKPTQRKSKNSN